MPSSLPADCDLSIAAGTAAHDWQGGSAVTTRFEGFSPATPVATPDGDRPIETLSPGDTVELPGAGTATVLGRLDRRLDAAFQARNPAGRPIRIAAGALGPGLPRVDLWIAPDQAILLAGKTATARRLVNGVTITEAPAAGPIAFIRLRLSAAAALSVAGAAFPTRPCPDDPAQAVAVRAITERIAAIATDGPLHGSLEEAGTGHVAGWVRDITRPGVAVPIAVAMDGWPVAFGFAEQHRPDLDREGLGANAFFIPFRRRPAAGQRWLTVRRASDRTDLPGSPALLRGASFAPVDFSPVLGRGGTDLAGALFAAADRLVDASGPPEGQA